jgi:hypothetical protein
MKIKNVNVFLKCFINFTRTLSRTLYGFSGCTLVTAEKCKWSCSVLDSKSNEMISKKSILKLSVAI